MPSSATKRTSGQKNQTSPAPDEDKGAAHMSEQERKRLRNRLSQQAFRRRQAERIRELSSRVNADQKSDSERIEALQRENRQLRTQLVEVQAKMARLMATLQGLNDSVSQTLDDTAAGGRDGGCSYRANDDDDAGRSSAEPSPSRRPEHERGNGPHTSLLSASAAAAASSSSSSSYAPMELEAFDASLLEFDPSLPMPSVTEPLEDDLSSSELINVAGTSPLYAQIPNIWSFEYQTGIEPYMTAMAATQESSTMLRKDWALSNSPFSDHIQLLQRLLKDKLRASGFALDGQQLSSSSSSMQSIYQPVLMVLSMFNSITRPDVMAWYAKTRFYHIVELTAWQLCPSTATFERLHPRYRPTETQRRHPDHPRVVDWIPFPSIRDRLIRRHAANPRIDQIFCDAVTGYVVEASMADLVRGAPRVTVHVRVTDLITAMSSESSSSSSSSSSSLSSSSSSSSKSPTSSTTTGGESDLVRALLPAPDIATLFSSPAHARAAFKLLNMDRGASYYKIDPAFYAKYPELYDEASDLTASGIALRPASQKVLTYPRPLDAATVETYRSFIDFSLDAANAISSSSSSSS
ncbi:Putative basic-leucine zipper domain-containing protein [Colletotrichum destructivum]|uniref:Basic-leucine zipper domain-containing protein n=1 Tax=Colletotrichum destructivum TaxID=34406 RepID=A0AAX4IB97_9PEZI|nr:Putative basic-leucine zipper domain-containing protein [Colletotrichum destructivum]